MKMMTILYKNYIIFFTHASPVKHATRYYTPHVKTRSKLDPYIRQQKRSDYQCFYKHYEHLRL